MRIQHSFSRDLHDHLLYLFRHAQVCVSVGRILDTHVLAAAVPLLGLAPYVVRAHPARLHSVDPSRLPPRFVDLRRRYENIIADTKPDKHSLFWLLRGTFSAQQPRFREYIIMQSLLAFHELLHLSDPIFIQPIDVPSAQPCQHKYGHCSVRCLNHHHLERHRSVARFS